MLRTNKKDKKKQENKDSGRFALGLIFYSCLTSTQHPLKGTAKNTERKTKGKSLRIPPKIEAPFQCFNPPATYEGYKQKKHLPFLKDANQLGYPDSNQE